MKGKYYQDIYLSKVLADLADPEAARVEDNVTAAMKFKGVRFRLL